MIFSSKAAHSGPEMAIGHQAPQLKPKSNLLIGLGLVVVRGGWAFTRFGGEKYLAFLRVIDPFSNWHNQ